MLLAAHPEFLTASLLHLGANRGLLTASPQCFKQLVQSVPHCVQCFRVPIDVFLRALYVLLGAHSVDSAASPELLRVCPDQEGLLTRVSPLITARLSEVIL